MLSIALIVIFCTPFGWVGLALLWLLVEAIVEGVKVQRQDIARRK